VEAEEEGSKPEKRLKGNGTRSRASMMERWKKRVIAKKIGQKGQQAEIFRRGLRDVGARVWAERGQFLEIEGGKRKKGKKNYSPRTQRGNIKALRRRGAVD